MTSRSILTGLPASNAKHQLLASLSHPNIGAIYGFEEAPSTDSGQGTRALVLTRQRSNGTHDDTVGPLGEVENAAGQKRTPTEKLNSRGAW